MTQTCSAKFRWDLNLDIDKVKDKFFKRDTSEKCLALIQKKQAQLRSVEFGEVPSDEAPSAEYHRFRRYSAEYSSDEFIRRRRVVVRVVLVYGQVFAYVVKTKGSPL